MGPYQRTPKQVARAIRYSSFWGPFTGSTSWMISWVAFFGVVPSEVAHGCTWWCFFKKMYFQRWYVKKNHSTSCSRDKAACVMGCPWGFVDGAAVFFPAVFYSSLRHVVICSQLQRAKLEKVESFIIHLQYNLCI